MLFKENITLTKMLEFIKQKLNLVIRYKCIIYAINAIINYQISVFLSFREPPGFVWFYKKTIVAV